MDITGIQRALTINPTDNARPQNRPDSGKPLPPAGKVPPHDQPAPPSRNVEKALEQIRSFLKDAQRQLDFQFDESSGRTVITVINPESGEVIRQIPSEEVLKLAAMMRENGFHVFSATV